MADFDIKKWLDKNVVPLLSRDLRILSVFWNGTPANEVCVFLDAGPPAEDDTPFDPASWPQRAKSLIDQGFRFDALRDSRSIMVDGQKFVLFGGDGAPLISDQKVASIRLFRREEDGVGLILNVVCQYPSAPDAASAVKGFFGLFPEDPFRVLQEFGTPFGAA